MKQKPEIRSLDRKGMKALAEIERDIDAGDTDRTLEEAARRNPHLYRHKTLVLNADYQPLSYFPLSLKSWTKIMFWLVKGWQREREGGQPIIVTLEEYPDVFVQTGSGKIPLPSVVAHTEFIPAPKVVPFTRFNVFLRDDFTCQYSGVRMAPEKLTFDHVHPQSKGGKTTWDNIVTCSSAINEAKGDRSVREAGLHLIRPPYQPTVYELREKGKKHPPQYLHESWRDYLYWDTELEK